MIWKRRLRLFFDGDRDVLFMRYIVRPAMLFFTGRYGLFTLVLMGLLWLPFAVQVILFVSYGAVKMAVYRSFRLVVNMTSPRRLHVRDSLLLCMMAKCLITLRVGWFYLYWRSMYAVCCMVRSNCSLFSWHCHIKHHHKKKYHRPSQRSGVCFGVSPVLLFRIVFLFGFLITPVRANSGDILESVSTTVVSALAGVMSFSVIGRGLDANEGAAKDSAEKAQSDKNPGSLGDTEPQGAYPYPTNKGAVAFGMTSSRQKTTGGLINHACSLRITHE